MDTKILYIGMVIFVAAFNSMGCNKCEGDVFGRNMKLIVPINTLPSLDTFDIGDTLWIEANIDKYVEVEGESEKLFLEGFNFFTSLIISEISDTVENFAPGIEVLEQIGQVEILNLPTLQVYPLFFEEEEDKYLFKAGILFNEAGLYYINFDTPADIYENYEHSAMYYCEDTRRNSVDVAYKNISTNQESYENIFLETGVDYLIQLMDYSRYASIGTHTLIVRE